MKEWSTLSQWRWLIDLILQNIQHGFFAFVGNITCGKVIRSVKIPHYFPHAHLHRYANLHIHHLMEFSLSLSRSLSARFIECNFNFSLHSFSHRMKERQRWQNIKLKRLAFERRRFRIERKKWAKYEREIHWNENNMHYKDHNSNLYDRMNFVLWTVRNEHGNGFLIKYK